MRKNPSARVRRWRNKLVVHVVRNILLTQTGNLRLSDGSATYWRDALNTAVPLTLDDIQKGLTSGVRNGQLESELTKGSRVYGLPHKERR